MTEGAFKTLAPWLSVAVQGITILTVVSGAAWVVAKPIIQEAITENVRNSIRDLETSTAERAVQLETAFNENNAALAMRLSRLEAKLDIEPELRSLIALRCMGQFGVNSTITRLKRDYRFRTGDDYQEPDCERLVR